MSGVRLRTVLLPKVLLRSLGVVKPIDEMTAFVHFRPRLSWQLSSSTTDSSMGFSEKHRPTTRIHCVYFLRGFPRENYALKRFTAIMVQHFGTAGAISSKMDIFRFCQHECPQAVHISNKEFVLTA